MEDEALKQIEELAELQFLPEEIALALRLDRSEMERMIDAGDNPVADAYGRGRLKTEAEVRRSILTMAKQGSTPAQKQMIDLIEQNKRAISRARRRTVS